MDYIGIRIKKFREMHKLSRRAAAEALKISARAIYQYEKGNCTPRDTTRKWIEKGLREYRKGEE